MATPSIELVHAGFVPLADAAPLIIAKELGFDREHGLSLELHREVSWANIRDKLDVGAFECAHMLAPMPLAAALGLGRPTEPVVVPMTLSLNGNAITVSNDLHQEMLAVDPDSTGKGGMQAAIALKKVIARRKEQDRALLTFGMVFPFSAHNYDLRCWMAAAGIDPDGDVNLIVVPPPLLSESLRSGKVDGFCVGSPWNSVSVSRGDGVIVATKQELWPSSPEKVLGVRKQWAESHGAVLQQLIAALYRSCQWLDEAANRADAARILSADHYVGVPAEILRQPLTGRLMLDQATARQIPEMIIFNRMNANYPFKSHAVWFLTQMVRWGQARRPFSFGAIADEVYRPDLYRASVSGLVQKLPADEIRQEDSSGFFGGEFFNPRQPLSYLQRASVKSGALDLSGFALANM